MACLRARVMLLSCCMFQVALGLRSSLGNPTAELLELEQFERDSLESGLSSQVKSISAPTMESGSGPESGLGMEFMYLQAPHTATVTVLNGLGASFGLDSKHMGKYHSHSQLQARIDEVGWSKFQKLFSFTFVRSPWERVLSCAGWKGAIDGGKVNLHRTKAQNIQAFREFVKTPSSMKSCMKYMHHIVNYTHAKPPGESKRKMLLSFVGHVSDLKNDFSKAVSLLGMKPVDINAVETHCVTHCPEAGQRTVDPELFQKEKAKMSYTEYYDDETQAIVADLWKDDVKIFHFKFGQ